ncbi:hypothetical protein CEUSTIGMA_g5720.t1 [Chlamydomonas eustigma]|uniref:HTH La-type RNA-binding domain-containing protein n=1 Tax=Chlamydomonas eustigma TaxID=1157962 RepID=A0A250X5D4_9CHLO|nr:hypothetical protein CEUSTIGMA_g5720.t1 [Chlamydomonas eustigma]|eukprot:GAX78278.1 hypothetical protein CEUSTIGMA_g5720.t1 [Chlamydomonas eustigma]
MQADAKPSTELTCHSEDKPDVKVIESTYVSNSCASVNKDVHDQPPPPRKLSGWSALLKGGEQAKAHAKDSTNAENIPLPTAGIPGVALSIVVADKDSDVKAVLKVAVPTQPVPVSEAHTHDSAVSSEVAVNDQKSGHPSLPDMQVDKECREEARAMQPAKPAWKKPTVAEATVPLQQDWPTLVDAKQPSKKKERNDSTPLTPPINDVAATRDVAANGTKRPKNAKLPMSALGESLLASKESKGGNSSAYNNGYANGGRGGFTNGRIGQRSNANGVATSGTRRPHDNDNNYNKNKDPTSPSGAIPSSASATDDVKASSSGPTPGPTVGGRGGRGGRGAGRNSFPPSSQRNGSSRGPPTVPGPGPMMTPFMPPDGKATSSTTATPVNGNSYYSSSAYNLFYPPTAYGYPPAITQVAAAASSVAVPAKDQIMASVRVQVDYYFSVENLCKDIFLRSKMDEQGWIPLAIIANFNRVRMLTPNMMLIVEALKESTLVEVAPDSAYVRAKGTWETWILPPQQRDLAHNPVSSSTSRPPTSTAGDGTISAASDTAPASTSVAPAAVVTPSIHVSSTSLIAAASQPGSGGPGVSSILPIPSAALGASGGKGDDDIEEEEDLFEMDEDQDDVRDVADAAINNKTGSPPEDGEAIFVSDGDIEKLIVVTQSGEKKRGGRMDVKMAKDIADGLAAYEQELMELKGSNRNHRPPRAPSGGARIKSSFYGSSLTSQPQNIHHHMSNRRSAGAVAGESPPSHSFGWLMGASPDTGAGLMGTSPASRMGTSPASSSFRSRSILGSSPRGASPTVASSINIPKFQHPSHAMLEDKGFKQMKYVKWYRRCLEDRQRLGHGLSEEMNTLFRFWCYFMRDHFNENMHRQFVKFAWEDAQHSYNYGLECLFRFYSYGLEKKFKADMYLEFEQMTLKDFERGSLYGLEKFWAFHHYAGLPKDGNLEINPKLKALLEGEYKTLDAFKKEKARRLSEGEKKKAAAAAIQPTSTSAKATGSTVLSSSATPFAPLPPKTPPLTTTSVTATISCTPSSITKEREVSPAATTPEESTTAEALRCSEPSLSPEVESKEEMTAVVKLKEKEEAEDILMVSSMQPINDVKSSDVGNETTTKSDGTGHPAASLTASC